MEGFCMENWNAYNKFKMRIELITQFVGGNQELVIYFDDKEKKKWKIYFDFVWDFRYAIENAFIDRCYNMRQQEGAWTEDNSIYIVENSEYIKYFENQISGTYPTNKLKHFLIFDEIDTGIEILTNKEPIIIEI